MYGTQSCESIKRERDDLQRQMDDMRSEAERESERQYRERETRRREREEERRRQTPSNRLYHGDVTGFGEAVDCHIAACQQEITSPEPGDSEDLRATIERCNNTMNKSISEASRAKEIYHQITSETEARIAQALRVEGLTDWAECLESGDYSSMAI
jgi:hypothetical protein